MEQQIPIIAMSVSNKTGHSRGTKNNITHCPVGPFLHFGQVCPLMDTIQYALSDPSNSAGEHELFDGRDVNDMVDRYMVRN